MAETDVSSGDNTPQGNRELPKITPETLQDGMVASGSTGEHDSEDNTNYCGDKSNQDE